MGDIRPEPEHDSIIKICLETGTEAGGEAAVVIIRKNICISDVKYPTIYEEVFGTFSFEA